MVATSGRYHAGTWHLARCLVHLMDEIDRRWPHRSKISDGSIGDTSHQARPSDHNPDASGDVLAVDITEDHQRGPNLRDFWNDVIARRDPRVKYLIYEGQIVASYPAGGRPAWTPRPYSGVNAHAHHLHVSVHDHAKHNTATWFPEEDDMPYTPEQLVQHSANGVNRALSTDGSPARVGVREVVEKTLIDILSTPGHPVRTKFRELARMGSDDAEANDPPDAG